MTTPRSTAASRRPETRISRATIAATIQPGKMSSSIRTIIAARTSTLSATGSSSEPSGVVLPWRRASHPSIWSVAIAAMKSAVAQ